jgi:predicted PurR-regulated permease PerM
MQIPDQKPGAAGPVDPQPQSPADWNGGWRPVWPPVSYWARVAVVIVAVVAVAGLVLHLRDLFMVVIAAILIALGLQPALAFSERRGATRGTGMAVIILVGLLLAGVALASIIPAVFDQVNRATGALPDMLEDLGTRFPPLAGVIEGWQEGEATNIEGLTPFAGGVFRTTLNMVTLLVLIPYFATAMPTLKSGVFRLIGTKRRDDFVYLVNQATELTSNYMIGNLIVSVATAVVTATGLWLLGVPYALALGVWMGLADLIPSVGGLIGGIPVLVMAGLVGWPQLIGAAVLLLGYQQFENYWLNPRVMKKAVDLSPPAVILSLLVGASIAGVLGALLALPIAALSKVVVSELVVRDRIDKVRAEGAENATVRRSRGRIGSRPLP